jgi:hypothetical protein
LWEKCSITLWKETRYTGLETKECRHGRVGYLQVRAAPSNEGSVESDVADPVKVADQLPQGNLAARFNAWFAVQVTTGVGTMWCAYVFALIALVSLPSAIRSGDPVVLVSWVSQTFLQLVLLSVIIVGQNVLAASADKRSEATYKDADAVLHEAIKIQEHLAAQDKVLEDLIDKVRAQRG